MENASKALIIAGAILLAILLISLGIFIFNQAQDTVNNSGMTQAEITAYNNKFLKYEGEQPGSVVKSMINEALASNSDESLPDVKIYTGTSASKGTEIKTTSGINNASTYTVELGYADTGYIDEIYVDE